MRNGLDASANRMLAQHMDNTGMDGYAALADIGLMITKTMEGLMPIVHAWTEQMVSVARALVTALEPLTKLARQEITARAAEASSGAAKAIR